MGYRRTKEDKQFNNQLCHQWWVLYGTGEIPWDDLHNSGYKGSFPYGAGTAYKDFAIRQITDRQPGKKRYRLMKFS